MGQWLWKLSRAGGAPKWCPAGKWWTLRVREPDTLSKGLQTQAGDPGALGVVRSQES